MADQAGSRAGQHERVGDDERYSGRVIKVPGAGECTEGDRTGQDRSRGLVWVGSAPVWDGLPRYDGCENMPCSV